jgi:hypothetical protein
VSRLNRKGKMSEKLKQCPFCGGKTFAEVFGMTYPCYAYRIAHKEDCIIHGWGEIKEEDREPWNRRESLS